MQLKDPVHKNLCTLYVPSAVSGVSGLIVAMSKWWRFGKRARKDEVGDWRENGSNEKGSKCSHHSMKSGLMSAREMSCD